MKLSRQQELKLIDMGLSMILDEAIGRTNKSTKQQKKKKHWTQTPEGKSKLANGMKRMWRKKKAAKA